LGIVSNDITVNKAVQIFKHLLPGIVHGKLCFQVRVRVRVRERVRVRLKIKVRIKVWIKVRVRDRVRVRVRIKYLLPWTVEGKQCFQVSG
jgi:hypothetical protein